MVKPEWGTKRICPKTKQRFYDLGKYPVISPYTNDIVPIENPKASLGLETTARSKAEDNAKNVVDIKTQKPLETIEDIVDKDADDTLDDDILGDDDTLDLEDDNNVSLDDLADVPAPSDEEDDS